MAPRTPASSPSVTDQPVRNIGSLLFGVTLFFVAMLLGATIYAFGQRREPFDWQTFRNGAGLFLICVGGIAAGGAVLAVLFRFLIGLVPASVSNMSERNKLRQAKNRAVSAIDRRHRVQEEQARLTAMMQASYLYERESARTANAQALAEFRKALQSGVVSSCEVVFDHLNRTVEQYELVVAEIESCALGDGEKAVLLNELNRHLDVGGLTQRHHSAQKMMNDAIWRVRFRKARMMSRRSPESAIRYLHSVRDPEGSQRVLVQIDAMLQELSEQL